MEVATLVSSVLAGLSEENRSRCDRAAIMHVLGELGCAGNVSELQIMLTADADSVRDNLKHTHYVEQETAFMSMHVHLAAQRILGPF